MEKTDSDFHIRQDLVQTAVNFLLDPEIIPKSNERKTEFLRKKGMTEAEISTAFANVRMKLSAEVATPKAVGGISGLTRLTRFTSSAIVFSVALYGLQRFYQLYVAPWLFGKIQSVEEKLLAQISELNSTIMDLKSTVRALETTVQIQKQQIDTFLYCESNDNLPTPVVLNQLKSEISTLKSLLVSRHRFPSAPKVSIPQWQLTSKESNSDNDSENTAAEVAINGHEDEVAINDHDRFPSAPKVSIPQWQLTSKENNSDIDSENTTAEVVINGREDVSEVTDLSNKVSLAETGESLDESTEEIAINVNGEALSANG